MSNVATVPAPWAESLLSGNPFTENRVTGPGDVADVPAIHQAAFERLVTLAREVHAGRRGLGAVLWGEAGVGKSHVLARFARWAEAEKNAVAVYLHNLQAAPDRLPRSLLHAVVSVLTRGRTGDFSPTPLYRAVNDMLAAALRQEGVDVATPRSARQAFHALLDRLHEQDPGRVPLLDRGVFDVLFRFFLSAYMAYEGADDGLAAAAVRWLAGGAVSRADAERLGLAEGAGGATLADGQEVKKVLTVLAQATWYRGRPLVLCFDQVDNLDADQAAALARFLEALLDSAPNLLVLTAGVQATLFGWRGRVIQESAWDRLAQFEVALQRITPREAEQILAARLQRYFGDRPRPDPLFPLDRAWVESFLRERIDLRPREVLSAAGAAWRRLQESLTGDAGRHPPGVEPPVTPPAASLHEPIDRLVEEKLAECLARRRAEPYGLPPDKDNLAGLVYKALTASCKTANGFGDVMVDRPATKPPVYDLMVRRAGTRTGVLFLGSGHGNKTAGALRRVQEDAVPPERVLVVTEERASLRELLKKKGREYFDRLSERGAPRFRHLELTFLQHATLDALSSVLGLARAGDLELTDGRRVPEPDVLESYRRIQLYQRVPLLNELLTDNKVNLHL